MGRGERQFYYFLINTVPASESVYIVDDDARIGSAFNIAEKRLHLWTGGDAVAADYLGIFPDDHQSAPVRVFRQGGAVFREGFALAALFGV